jgi:hypothetical protein
MYVYKTTNFSMIKNVNRLKIVWAPFIWVLERALGLPPQLDPLLIRP